jgi:hypothetical protein
MAPGVVQADASNPAQRQANAARFVYSQVDGDRRGMGARFIGRF